MPLADPPPLAWRCFACGVVGDSRFRTVLYPDRLVRADERTGVRVGFQSSDAGDRGLGGIHGVGRKAAPRKVYIFNTRYMNTTQ